MFAEEPQLPAGESERLQGKGLETAPEAALVEHPDHDVFAVHAGHDGNPEIDGAGTAVGIPGKRRPEPPILRYPAFRDVELRHHLEPRDDGLVVRAVHRLHRRIENAVHPIFQDDLAGLRLDVDVGGAPLDGVQQQRIHQSDHGTPGLAAFQRVERNEGRAGLSVTTSQPLDPQILGRPVQQETGVGVPFDDRIDLHRVAYVHDDRAPE